MERSFSCEAGVGKFFVCLFVLSHKHMHRVICKYY